MKVENIQNAVQVDDIDLYDDKACIELGKLVAHECVAYLPQSVTEERLHQIHMLWGQPCLGIVFRFFQEGLLSGRHWRSIISSLGRIARDLEPEAAADGMLRVSFAKDRKGKPTGIFTNGQLGWHSDSQPIDNAQAVIGLMSLSGTENSQTSFLCTAPAYEALNHEDKTTVDELITVWNWDGDVSHELIPEQKELIKFSAFPMPEMECPLVMKTATGRRGMRFPSHSFLRFKGMSLEESITYRNHLWSIINRSEYIYSHNWRDGEIIFMDQTITLHARPTNIKDGNKRTLCRMNSHLDNLFPNAKPRDSINYKGKELSFRNFAKLVDQQRLREFQNEYINEGHV